MKRLTLILIAMFISGCAGSMPQTADEFRKAIPQSSFGKVETFEVKRPLQDVARTFQKKADECLSKSIRTTSRTSTGYGVSSTTYTTTYKPTVLTRKEKVELNLQEHMEGGNIIKVYKEPEGGYYSLVLDATPVNKNTTRIDMYHGTIGNKLLIKAIKGWATGEITGCPDLTKN